GLGRENMGDFLLTHVGMSEGGDVGRCHLGRSVLSDVLIDVRASLVTHVDSSPVKSLRYSLVVWSTVRADGLETWDPGGGNFQR
ncbi:hypothetical protein, partial [Streptomyces sp. NPDC056290]|uniref:hypothetical protein n=1 Tax=Streptomyces sp. NPDC056290 TaxID=3345771 RepID=UPI0035D9ADE2